MKVAVLIPSRGLVSSRMVESVERELLGISSVKLFTHDLPIPHCFNSLVEEFLKTDAGFAWFVEEDTVPPVGCLKRMLEHDADVISVNYPERNFRSGITQGFCQGRRIYIGLGCTLVRRRVFEVLEAPWFQTGYRMVSVHEGSASRDRYLALQFQNERYGSQDTYFCFHVLQAGFELQSLEGELCEHVQIGELMCA